MQNIVYGEYLPTILGVDFMKSYDLIVAEETKYDPNVDSSVFNAFATVRVQVRVQLKYFDLYLSGAGHVVPFPECADDVEVGDGHEHQGYGVQKYSLYEKNRKACSSGLLCLL